MTQRSRSGDGRTACPPQCWQTSQTREWTGRRRKRSLTLISLKALQPPMTHNIQLMFDDLIVHMNFFFHLYISTPAILYLACTSIPCTSFMFLVCGRHSRCCLCVYLSDGNPAANHFSSSGTMKKTLSPCQPWENLSCSNNLYLLTVLRYRLISSLTTVTEKLE